MTKFIESLNHAELRMLANAVFGEPLLQLVSLARPANNHDKRGHLITAPAPDISCQAQHRSVFSLDKLQQAWLTELDRDPTPLLQHLDELQPGRSGRVKLGIYHEQLWSFFLQHNPYSTLIASNLKISAQKDQSESAINNASSDIGEFDFLYAHKAIGLVHLEVASKYYLADSPHTEQWHSWPGPGRKDRLDIKLKHCLKKQINLADHDAAKIRLALLLDKYSSNNAHTILHKHIMIGGILFYPAANVGTTAAIKDRYKAPLQINKHHQQGLWWTASEWRKLITANPDIEYRQITRPRWIDTAQGCWKDSEASGESEERSGSLLHPVFITYRFNGKSETAATGFIVPDGWAA